MGGKYQKKGEGTMKIGRGTHTRISMTTMAKAAGVQACTIQQNVNILMKYVLPQMK